MGQLATISAAKLGLITLPPINTFTEIADAAMETIERETYRCGRSPSKSKAETEEAVKG